jgi:hypothetical protein
MMAFNFNYGFTPEQIKKLMTPPTPPPTGIETMADKVGMGDFTAEVPVAETFDYRGFNPFNPTGVPGSVGPDDKPFNPGYEVPVPPVPVPPVPVPPVPDTGVSVPPGFNPFNPTGVSVPPVPDTGVPVPPGFNPFNPTGVSVPPVPDTEVPVPPGFNPFNPYGGTWTGVVPGVTAPVVDPVANLTPMPPRDTNVRVATNYPRKAPPPTFFEPSINPFERPEE